MTLVRFLALGDSYTIGESVPIDERWPLQLVARLRARGLVIDPPEIIAQTGWTTDELASALQRADPQPPYDLVSLLIGVNNQYRRWSRETYRKEFASLLSQAVEFVGGSANRVIVLSIPDWGVTPFAASDPHGRTSVQISDEVVAFNAINYEETASLGAYYVDITSISRKAETDLSLLAPDQLHPSGKMYRIWAERVFPIAHKILSI